MNLNVRKIIIIIYILIIMSGFIPKRVRNARMQTKTDQPGLKMQGNPAAIGRNSVLTRYINKRVQTTWGLCGRPGDMGFRCRYGVDPSTAGKDALMKYCEFCATPDRFCLNEAPKHQGMAGGVGRVNAPGFKCNGCGALSSGRFIHPHFRPRPGPVPGPGPPLHPPYPQPPSGTANYTLSIAMYGLDKDITEGAFEDFCDNYINFIKDKGQSIEIDRIILCLSDNPGAGYNPVASGFVGDNMTDNMNGVFNKYMAISTFTTPGHIYDKPKEDIWLYKYFVEKIIDRNLNKSWGGKTDFVEVGFSFAHGKSDPDLFPNSNWTVFVKDGSDDLKLPTGKITFSANLSNMDGNNITNTRNNIAQEFAYIRHINILLSVEFGKLSDLSLTTLQRNPLASRVNSATWDTEGEYQDFTSQEMDILWNKFLGDGESDLNPRYSNTKGFKGITNEEALNSLVKGPDREYYEAYDLYSPSKAGNWTEPDACEKKGNVVNYVDIRSGLGTNTNGEKFGDLGWDVAVPVLGKHTGLCGFTTPAACANHDACGVINIKEVNVGFNGSKYFFAKWNTDGTSNGFEWNGFATYPSSPSDANASLKYYVNLMVNTGWAALSGSLSFLHDSVYAKNTPALNTLAGDNGNGRVIMFSLQSRYWTDGGETILKNPLAGGEEAFGSWSWNEFKYFMDQMAKKLHERAIKQGHHEYGTSSNPIRFGLYEAQYIPMNWLNN